jgi:hypothetical protein
MTQLRKGLLTTHAGKKKPGDITGFFLLNWRPTIYRLLPLQSQHL